MTVEVQARYVTELNDSFPRSRDLIKEGDDHIRLVKNVLKNTFPRFSSSVNITSDKLNRLDADIAYDSDTLKLNKSVKFETNQTINMNGGTIINVSSVDADNAVEPRSYNDARYVSKASNLSDVADKGAALKNLLSGGGTDATATFKTVVMPLMYPVGSLYFNADSDANPSTLLGFGSWVQFGAGRVMLGRGELHDGRESRNFGRGVSGGTFTHTLSIGEMPSHNHAYEISRAYDENGNSGDYIGQGQARIQRSGSRCVYPAGGSAAHNNMQPYITVSIWKRTA